MLRLASRSANRGNLKDARTLRFLEPPCSLREYVFGGLNLRLVAGSLFDARFLPR